VKRGGRRGLTKVRTSFQFKGGHVHAQARRKEQGNLVFTGQHQTSKRGGYFAGKKRESGQISEVLRELVPDSAVGKTKRGGRGF